jgi:hypothetical protein
MLARIDEAEQRAREAENRAREAVSGVAKPLETPEAPAVMPPQAEVVDSPPQASPPSPEPVLPEQPAPAATPAVEEPSSPSPAAAGPEGVAPEPPAATGSEDLPVELPDPSEMGSVQFLPLNLNDATFEQLRDVGLSVTQTGRVLAHRERSGHFESIDELEGIPGFPAEFLAQIKARLTV